MFQDHPQSKSVFLVDVALVEERVYGGGVMKYPVDQSGLKSNGKSEGSWTEHSVHSWILDQDSQISIR